MSLIFRKKPDLAAYNDQPFPDWYIEAVAGDALVWLGKRAIDRRDFRTTRRIMAIVQAASAEEEKP